MSDVVRAVAPLLSVLLWSPVAPGLLSGAVPAERALLLYVAALLLCLGGCGLLSAIVRAYSLSTVDEPEPGPAPSADPAPGRRAEDVLSSG